MCDDGNAQCTFPTAPFRRTAAVKECTRRFLRASPDTLAAMQWASLWKKNIFENTFVSKTGPPSSQESRDCVYEKLKNQTNELCQVLGVWFCVRNKPC